jgi:hypothetical protein
MGAGVAVAVAGVVPAAVLEDRDVVTGALVADALLVVLAVAVAVGSLTARVTAVAVAGGVGGGELVVTADVLDVADTTAPPGEQALSTATTAQRAISRRPSLRILALPLTRPIRYPIASSIAGSEEPDQAAPRAFQRAR